MAVEIEIKLKVDDHAAIRRRLQELGATRVRAVLETNVFFDTADRALLGSDCGLRLRCNRDLASGAEELIVTYKGPRAEGPVKRREELELHVDHRQQAVTLFERLGYLAMLTFEKRRETWQLDGCSIELDDVPTLGTYVEIEGPSDAKVLELRSRLGLEHLTPVVKSYADLVAHHLSDRGKGEASLTF